VSPACCSPRSSTLPALYRLLFLQQSHRFCCLFLRCLRQPPLLPFSEQLLAIAMGPRGQASCGRMSVSRLHLGQNKAQRNKRMCVRHSNHRLKMAGLATVCAHTHTHTRTHTHDTQRSYPIQHTASVLAKQTKKGCASQNPPRPPYTLLSLSLESRTDLRRGGWSVGKSGTNWGCFHALGPVA